MSAARFISPKAPLCGADGRTAAGRWITLRRKAACDRRDLVEVPLGPRRVLGVVWGREGGFDCPRARCARWAAFWMCRPDARRIARLSDPRSRLHADPLPAMLRLATRAPGLFDPPPMRRVYRPGRRLAQPDDRGARCACGCSRRSPAPPSRWRNGRGGGRQRISGAHWWRRRMLIGRGSPRDGPSRPSIPRAGHPI
jgi:hypothetical protein